MDSLPPWSVVQALLLKVVLPGFGVGAGLLAGVITSRPAGVAPVAARAEGRPPSARDWATLLGPAVALMAGFAAGNGANGLVPWWSLEPGWTSLFPATFVAVAGGIVAALVAGPARASAWRLVTLAVCAWWLTAGGEAQWVRLGFFSLLFVVGTLNLGALGREGIRALDGYALPALSLLWGMAAAIVLIYAHSARFFDLAVLVTAALAGVGLVAAWKKVDLSPLAMGPAVFFPGLMLAGAANTFSEVPVASFVLIGLAPAALWSLRLPPMRRWAGRSLAAAALSVVLIPCVAAVVLALRAETLDFGE